MKRYFTPLVQLAPFAVFVFEQEMSCFTFVNKGRRALCLTVNEDYTCVYSLLISIIHAKKYQKRIVYYASCYTRGLLLNHSCKRILN